MSNIRDLGQKINSLKNMQKVMRAMNMISSIKLRKLYTVQDSLALFDQSVDGMRKDINNALLSSLNPLVKGYKEVLTSHIIMFTSDKGLCGAHNSSVQKAVDLLIQENLGAGIQVDITCIGNKGVNYCKRKEHKIFQQSEINEKVFTVEQLRIISLKVLKRYLDNRIQKLYVVGNMFHSVLRQETVTLQLLPLFISDKENTVEGVTVMATEPGGDQLAISAAEIYLFFKLQSILTNSYLSEQASRMTAMENATNNSEDLINKYITIQNHARQASITNELIEIVSGKEALKG